MCVTEMSSGLNLACSRLYRGEAHTFLLGTWLVFLPVFLKLTLKVIQTKYTGTERYSGRGGPV